jgi:hypothetical protein
MFEVHFYKGTRRVSKPELADRAYLWALRVCMTFPATPEGRADLQRAINLANVQFGSGYRAAQSDIRAALAIPVDK